jgi:YfiH family protein
MATSGVAFSTAADGDLRDPADRERFSRGLGIPVEWAVAHQVHGARVLTVAGPGSAGDADGLVTTAVDLPLAVFTADCLGVVAHGGGVVAVAHAGWRGLAAGVLEATVGAMEALEGPPEVVRVGPSIGPCCYEVGPEVVDAVGHRATTTWGSSSVDLRAAAVERLAAAGPGADLRVDDRCTRCDDGLHSHRGSGTPHRLAAVGWRS